MRRPFLFFFFGTAGLALGISAEVVAFEWSDPEHWVPDLVTGWTLIACGLVAWTRRPQSRMGGLLAASGFTWFLGNFLAVGGVAGWVARQTVYLHRGPLFQAVIAYPSGRASSKIARTAIIVFYAVAILPAVWSNEPASIVLAALLVAVTATGYVRSVGPDRRARFIALRSAAGLGVVIAVGAIARLILSESEVGTVALLAYQATLCAVAVGLTAALLSASWERSVVTDLVVELGEVRSGTLRGELARALGDPSLEVGYWDPDLQAFADAEGRRLTLPGPGSDRAVTIVEREQLPIAVLVHDPAVLQDPGLKEAVTSAARLAASNVRLQAEVRTRVGELEASRRRLLEAGDEERRRLERRLHDGAERRLQDLADVLRRGRASSDDGETRLRIARAHQQLTVTLEDLNLLARGLHPRALSEHGLEHALTRFVEMFPIPVQLRIGRDRLPPDAELVAYFVCSEALANVAKHAAASRAIVSVTTDDRRALIEVEDDGVGGADVSDGTGLRNLIDRVQTLGGTIVMESPRGGGTRLAAEIPIDGEAR
jgi:signal transduction histidine kinase